MNMRVVGWGPFPLPGEKRRWAEAYEHARQLVNRTQVGGTMTVIPGQLTLFDADQLASPSRPVTATVGFTWIQRCRDLLDEKRRELWRNVRSSLH